MSLETIKRSLSEGSLQTPCFVYSAPQIVDNYRRLKAAVGTKVILSIKANSCIDLLLRISHEANDGYEVASAQELNLIASNPGGYKFLNNPSMQAELMRMGIGAKAHIIIDSLDQIAMLRPFVGKKTLNPLLLRVNSSVLKQMHAQHPAVREDHFGFDLDGLLLATQEINKLGLQLGGLHLFKGSYTFSKTAMATVDVAEQLVQRVEAAAGYALTIVNLGGGFGERWQEEDFDFAAYRQRLARLQEDYEVLHESGRGIFAQGGYFLSKVVASKSINDKAYAICDGGLAQSFLLCQTENSFKKLKQPVVWSAQSEPETAASPVYLAGSTCSKDDIIGKLDPGSPLPRTGDVCIFDNCGAYHSSYSPSRFLSLGQAREYVLND